MRVSLRHTEGAFDPGVDGVPAGHSVAPSAGSAPIPGPPPAPEEDPDWSRRDDGSAADPVVVAAADDGVGPRGRPSRTRRPILAIRRPPWPGAIAPERGGARASGGWATGTGGTVPSAGAAEALRGLDPPPAWDLIKAGDARLRVQIIRVLGEGYRVHVTVALAQLWQGGDPAIRRAIVEAVLTIGPASLEPSPTEERA